MRTSCRAALRPTPAALREHLRATLPEYMLPQHIVALDAIPLLPNGKIDRKCAAGAGDAGVAARRASAATGDRDRDRAVADVWQRLLGVEHVGRDDNFFDLGGHSLLAMRAIDDIEKRLGFRPHLRRLIFETLAQIAASPPERAQAPWRPPSARAGCSA